MKINSEFRLSFFFVLGTLIIVLFTSYGNKQVHRDINFWMLQAFLANQKTGEASWKELSNFSFDLNGTMVLTGDAVTKDGLFHPGDQFAASSGYSYSEEGSATLTPLEWIIHGGFSADVPEVPASLRHFYDPTRAIGDRYLTDIANAQIMGSLQKYMLPNPQTDGVQWALGIPGYLGTGVQEHHYTWERGKAWIQLVLSGRNPEKNNEFMAKAWRALGETLHMIADNGCPAHVRNDAHPSPLWNNNTWFGNPDPYEELIDILKRNNTTEFARLLKGSVAGTMNGKFDTLTSVSRVAHEIALYTNAGFVTNETISGTDKTGAPVFQKANPASPYSSPLLQHMTYQQDEYAYYFNGIRQCSDKYYLGDVVPINWSPFVDFKSVISQAAALLPVIREAGANAIRLFIPKLSIEIISVEDGMLKGLVKHKTNDEYPGEIKYTGDLTLIVKDKSNREKKKILLKVKDGSFEKSGIQTEDGETITAMIEFGGIRLESDVYNETDKTIFGNYEGFFIYSMDPATFLRKHRDHLNPNLTGDALDAGERDAKNMADYEMDLIRNMFKSANEQKVNLSITTLDWTDANFDMQGLRYIVINKNQKSLLPATFMPLKDRSNGVTKLETGSHGFNLEMADGAGISYKLSASVANGQMAGNFSQSYKGSVLFSGSFKANKVND